MKLNTETFELYGGERNIELAEERGEPLVDVDDAMAERMLHASPAERRAIYEPAPAPVEEAPDLVTVSRSELEQLIHDAEAVVHE